jgi:VanZ family protein
MLNFLSIPPTYRWIITLVFVAIVIVLSVTPGRFQAGDSVFVWLIANTPTALQKFMHIAVYATLAMLFMWSLETIESRITRIVLTLVLALSLGAFLEWYQTRVPGRFGTIVDVLLNTAGTIVGLVAALFVLL